MRAFIYGVFTFFRALFFGIPVEGWASIMVSLYLIGGMLIGILGEARSGKDTACRILLE